MRHCLYIYQNITFFFLNPSKALYFYVINYLAEPKKWWTKCLHVFLSNGVSN